MKHDRPISIPLYITDIPIMGKTFDRPKLDEDLEVGVRGLYQDHGYFKAVVDVKDLKTVTMNKSGIPLPMPGIGAKHGQSDEYHDIDRRGRAIPHGQAHFPQRRSRTRAWSSSPNSWRGFSR